MRKTLLQIYKENVYWTGDGYCGKRQNREDQTKLSEYLSVSNVCMFKTNSDNRFVTLHNGVQVYVSVELFFVVATVVQE